MAVSFNGGEKRSIRGKPPQITELYHVLFISFSSLIYSLSHLQIYITWHVLNIDLAQSPELSPVMDFSLFTPPFASTRHVDINGYIFTYNKDVLVSIQVN